MQEDDEKVLNFNLQRYSDRSRRALHDKCVILMTNCVSVGTAENRMAAYDALYVNYCLKFETMNRN